MPFRIRPSLILAITLAPIVTGLRPAAAATPPPPVSGITVTERAAHRLGISFVVPAAYYAADSGGVVRLTRGYTPAAAPGAGYAVAVSGRTARTSDGLTPNVVYTLAIWVRSSGALSPRRTTTLITRPDVVSNGHTVSSVVGPTAGSPRVRIAVIWTNPAGPLKAVRVVRNTSPTTTGGTVITLPGSTFHWTDTSFPSSTCANTSGTGCSTAPVHYWIRPESTTSGYADRYVRVDAAVGDHAFTGTVSGNYKGVVVFCCPNPIDGSVTLVTSAAADPAVNGGAFTVHVPAGRYSVCTSNRTNGNDGLCWIVDRDLGTATAQPWDGTLDSGQANPTLDLTDRTTYPGVTF